MLLVGTHLSTGTMNNNVHYDIIITLSRKHIELHVDKAFETETCTCRSVLWWGLKIMLQIRSPTTITQIRLTKSYKPVYSLSIFVGRASTPSRFSLSAIKRNPMVILVRQALSM